MAVALMVGAVAAQAAGLGKLTINSALGQPLNAEIELVSLQPGEVDSLSARVAPPEAFRDARIEYGPSLRLLRFSVETRANGSQYLKVTSAAPINEPFVDVLVEVTWPAGRVQREYPILLDPPGYAQGRVTAPAVAASPPPAVARTESTPPAATPAATPSEGTSSMAPVTAGSGSPSASTEMPRGDAGTTAGSDTYGPVQKGETLRKIAEQVKPADVSMEQMLVSLFRENKGAFAGNNMNRLKTGQILKVPTAEEVNAIEAKEASREIRAHVNDWKAYREQLAGGVSNLPARPETSNAASGRVASAAVTPPAPPPTGGPEVLKLSKSDNAGKAGSAKAGGSGGDQARVNALQEEVIAKDKALKEAQSRVADLEKQIRDMQRVIDLQAKAPAKAPDTKVAVAPPPTPAKVEPTAPKVEAPKAEPPKAEAPKVATTEAPRPAEAPKPSEPAKVAEAAKTEPPKTEPPKAAAPKKAPAVKEKSLTDELADNWMFLAGGIAAVGLILFGVFAFVRRRKAGAEAGPSSAMTSAFPSDLKAPTGPGKAGGGLVDTGNSSFLTDFDKTGPGAIDTDEVDPVAEAEVYIAYGRDQQAEEILKEAMARDKNRHEIALKLLEIYHARKSATAFETVAKELHSAVGDSSPVWQKAAAMGYQIDPNNPLYASAAGSAGTYTASAPAAKPDVDFSADSGGGATASTDFDLDAGKSAPDIATESAPSMDFDLEASSSQPTPVAEPEPAKEDKPAFDFDLSGLELGGSKPAPAASSPSHSSGGGGLELHDLSLDSGGVGGGGEAVGTKLELAKAYLEIGDKDGAREILNEVAKEGSASQQEEAKKLIASL